MARFQAVSYRGFVKQAMLTVASISKLSIWKPLPMKSACGMTSCLPCVGGWRGDSADFLGNTVRIGLVVHRVKDNAEPVKLIV